MPELKLPNIKLRGFRDMTTDDIKQALSDVPRPDVNLSEIAEAAIAATQAAAKAAQEAAAAAQSAAEKAAERTPIRQQGRSRRPLFVIGAIVAGLGLVAFANADRIRARVAEMSERARERMDAERVSGSLEQMGSDQDGYTGSVGIPVQGGAYADALPSAAEPTMQPAGHAGSSTYQPGVAPTEPASSQQRQENPAETYRG